MNNQLAKDISVNTLQVAGNQFLGVFIFLLISRYLDKPVFGELSWSLAVLTFITTILSFRLEQIVVRNVAAGDDASKMLTLFTAHNLVTGVTFFIVLSVALYCYPAFFNRHSLLWIVSISQLISFFSLPFRQLVTGRSAFGWLAILSTVSNLIRAVWLFWLVIFPGLTLRWVLIIFTLSSLAEFLTGLYIVSRRLNIRLSTRWRLPEYSLLIKESMPQLAMVFLNAAIARMDWILLGIFSTPARTAEYSFAYRAFEFSPLPLLILAPFLLNRISRSAGTSGSAVERAVRAATSGSATSAWPDFPWLSGLVRAEMIFATLLPLLLNIAWSPVVGVLTHYKYGAANAPAFFILSCCLPFQYLTNILWTVEFANNRLARIFTVTAITTVVVLAGDFLLIPAYAGTGAALAYLIAMIVQYILYSRFAPLSSQTAWWGRLLIIGMVTLCSVLPAYWLTTKLLPRLSIATGLYILLAWATGQIRIKDLVLVWTWIPGKKEGPVLVVPDKTY